MKVIDKPTLRSRGRKAEYDATLLETLASLEVGTWAVFDDEFGTVTDGKTQAKIGQKVRSHFAALNRNGEKLTVRWSPQGDCQVGILATEDDAEADADETE